MIQSFLSFSHFSKTYNVHTLILNTMSKTYTTEELRLITELRALRVKKTVERINNAIVKGDMAELRNACISFVGRTKPIGAKVVKK